MQIYDTWFCELNDKPENNEHMTNAKATSSILCGKTRHDSKPIKVKLESKL
jgi:hypothetical protein